MWRKFIKFLRMDAKLKAYVVEAFLYLGWARILKAMPFAKVAPGLGVEMQETSMELDPSKFALVRDISRTVRMVSKVTPWESKCLVMAIACMKMLEKRGIESTLYLGTGRDHEGKMLAHAWLRSGPYYLTGVDEIPLFTVVGKFAKFITDSRQQTKPVRSMTNG